MKISIPQVGLAVALAASSALLACPDKTVGGHIDDALNNRPAEKVQDKAEEIGDKIDRATK